MKSSAFDTPCDQPVDWLLKSRTLRWCLDHGFDFDVESDVMQGHLAQWQQVLLQNPHYMQTRLRLDGIGKQKHQSLPQNRPTVLTESELRDSRTLKRISERARDLAGQQDVLIEFADIPFALLLHPIVDVAVAQQHERYPGTPLSLLQPAAHSAICRALFATLSELTAKTLFSEFVQARSELSSPTGVFRAFVQAHMETGLSGLFDRFPVLARLIVSAMKDWGAGLDELLTHLQCDLPELGIRLGSAPEALATVSGLEASGDRHNGRCVTIITLGTGQRVVYKPRSMRAEQLYNELLTQLNAAAGCELDGQPLCRATWVLDRGHYGWQEFIEPADCDTPVAARNYFVRVGTLLSVLHVTRTIDANYENLVAAGEFPVLIDTETILHPDLPPLSFGDPPGTVANDTFYHERWLRSCARVRLLPHKVARNYGEPALDLSAIGCIRPQPVGQTQQWINCNQDGMNLESIATFVRPTHNVARLAGQPLEPSQYVSEICEGFRRGCEILLTLRSQLLAPDGLWELFRDCTARVLFRNTDIYARTLENSTNPQNLKDGFDYSLCFEPLSLPFLLESGNDSRWPIFQIEQRQLERGQVPYFVRSADSRELDGPTGEVLCREFFPQSALLDSRQYLAKLSEDEIAFQQFVIRGVFTAEFRATTTALPCDSPNRLTFPAGQAAITDAVTIADALCASSMSASSGAVNWMSVQDLPGGESAAFGPLPDRLYDGRLGIAVFLAAVDCVQGTDQYRELLNRATSELRAMLSRRWASQAALLSGGLGATHGWGGILYGLTRLATLSGDETFLDSAMCAATAIDRNLIRHDRQFDLFSGSAGLTVGLLALHDVIGEPQLLTLANACGEHLLNHQRVQEHGASWEFPVKPFAPGLAHGNAGVALALARLFQATRSESFVNAAKDALQFEDIKLAGASLDRTLCGGMTGSLLARWGCSMCAPDELSEFFVNALPSLEHLSSARMPVSQLCCGRAGVEELRIALASTSRQARGDHRDNENEAAAFSAMDDPSLFRGLAGSGYVRLRSAAPDLVPCVPLFL